MASITLGPSDRLPPGTSSSAYPESNWATHQRPPSGAPVGASAAGPTAVGADGKVTFSGLTEGVYVWYGLVGGEHRYVRFRVDTALGSNPDFGPFTDGQFAKWDTTQRKFVGDVAGAGMLGGANTWTAEQTFNEGITLPDATGAAGKGVQFAADTNLYRAEADHLRSDDKFSSMNDIIARANSANSVLIGALPSGAGIQLNDVNMYRSAADVLALDDDFAVNVVGKGLRVKEGANAKMGVATLVGGTVTVATTAVTAASRIFLCGQGAGASMGELNVSARVAGTSFTISSANASDDRQVAWLILEPA